MKHQLKTFIFDHQNFLFRDDGWFNATTAAEKYGKRPVDWLALKTTQEYIEALKTHLGISEKSSLITARRNAGTWLHPKLAVAFARWLDVDFAIWCDLQIDNLIRSYADWSKVRYAASLGTSHMNLTLKGIRAAKGKETQGHHYMIEAKLVNSAFSGKPDPIDRDLLTDEEIQFLADIIQHNTFLLLQGLEYAQRKVLLLDFAEMKRPQAPAIEFESQQDDAEDEPELLAA